jgi:hypothetical protein
VASHHGPYRLDSSVRRAALDTRAGRWVSAPSPAWRGPSRGR